MDRENLSSRRFLLVAKLLIFAGIIDAGEAFVPCGENVIRGSRTSVPRTFSTTQQLYYAADGSASHRSGSGSRRSGTVSKNKSQGRRRKHKGPVKKNKPPNNAKNTQHQKVSRPASFAAIRKEMRKDGTSEKDGEGPKHVIDAATIARIGRKRHHERQQEQQARKLAKEERQELKFRAYQLSIDAERGFRATPQQAKEMRSIIERLTELNPTMEPAWSYYGKRNPLTRQLYMSLANEKGKQEDENEDLASLEGKWILTYTNVPSIVSLARDSQLWGLAKLGRIGQECTPFPDYTVRTIIEWKRPDWVQDMETNLPEGVSRLLFGKAESSVLQKTTLRARATPDDPTSWGVSKIPRVFEVVSSTSSSALYDDDDETTSTLSFVTDDGMLALDPLKPLKIGLQIAGMNDEQGLFLDEDDKKEMKNESSEAGGTSLVTKNGLVALNPFQPWTVGLQMAGFTGKKANEPWKIADEIAGGDHDHHGRDSSNNLFDDIQKRGLVEGVLKQTPIQLPTPDGLASLLGDVDEATGEVGRKQEADIKTDSKSESPGKQRILYLDDDIRIIGNEHNHFTIESRACTDQNEDCWF